MGAAAPADSGLFLNPAPVSCRIIPNWKKKWNRESSFMVPCLQCQRIQETAGSIPGKAWPVLRGISYKELLSGICHDTKDTKHWHSRTYRRRINNDHRTNFLTGMIYKIGEVHNGQAPLMKMFGYVSTLRTLSSGRPSYAMEFFNYAPLPKPVDENVIAEVEEKKKR
ncbi:MAG: hypothetical protein JSV44_11985 [Candidatus Zixiibacteriota bacterium]|nr:MAG: hypothetical protein JSV44_11985 [candidate division Zixibacteria bacterium]